MDQVTVHQASTPDIRLTFQHHMGIQVKSKRGSQESPESFSPSQNYLDDQQHLYDFSSLVTGSFDIANQSPTSTQRDRPKTDLGPGQTPSASDDYPRGPWSWSRENGTFNGYDEATSFVTRSGDLMGGGFCISQTDRQSVRVCSAHDAKTGRTRSCLLWLFAAC